MNGTSDGGGGKDGGKGGGGRLAILSSLAFTFGKDLRAITRSLSSKVRIAPRAVAAAGEKSTVGRTSLRRHSLKDMTLLCGSRKSVPVAAAKPLTPISLSTTLLPKWLPPTEVPSSPGSFGGRMRPDDSDRARSCGFVVGCVDDKVGSNIFSVVCAMQG